MAKLGSGLSFKRQLNVLMRIAVSEYKLISGFDEDIYYILLLSTNNHRFMNPVLCSMILMVSMHFTGIFDV